LTPSDFSLTTVFRLNLMLTRPGLLLKKFGFEKVFLIVLLLLSFFVRVSGLGYSHYYGDEIKTLYLDKTVTASKFLLDQRKGPVQFIATWFMEKISGGYDEIFIRLPFAIASVISVIVFYFVVKKLFGKNPAYYSTTIYAFSGFSVAFGRTAQYQSFLMLFGFLSILFVLLSKEKKKRIYLPVAALFWVLSVYSHYDGVFFLIPAVLFYTQSKQDLITFLKYFFLPSFLLLLPFYLPYILKGYLASNTVNYVSRRMSGSGYLPNNSAYTVAVYNPFNIFLILTLPGLISFFAEGGRKIYMVQIWFVAALGFYELVIKNPGTHIQNYLVPLIILSGYIISISGKYARYIASVLLPLYIGISFYTFVPSLNTGYPWKQSSVLGLNLNKIEKTYQLFLYGFPYNRGWDQIKAYFNNKNDVNGVYTNDNDSYADFYLRGFAYTRPGPNFLPLYYVHILDNQEIDNPKEDFLTANLSKYQLESEFFVEDTKVSQIYKLIK